MNHRYRPEIDGLRSLAVLPVVLFHAQIPWFTGGYVGVDVFFVISGFLITSILIEDMERGTYSVARFYERRIRRILPSLLTVLLFVMLAAPFVLLPSEFSRLWKEVLGALLFVANIVFWLDSGYFSSGAETRPLLHTWSLGIEEQFYIFAPIILFFILRYLKRHLVPIIAIGLLLSFAACVVITPRASSSAFYLLPTRAWELLAGSLLAALLRRPSHPLQLPAGVLREFIAWVGTILVLVPVFLYSKSTEFPGYAAALPVIGSTLVICYAEDTLLGRILSSRWLVFIGLISYSLYLWHWPLAVFFRDAGWLDSTAGKIGMVALSILAAWATWRFIERPTRDRGAFPVRKLLQTVLLGSVIVAGSALAYHGLGGWPSRVSPTVQAYDDARYDFSPSRAKCHILSGVRKPERFCTLGSGQLHVAVWGDSHGVELAQALSEQGISVKSITYSSCRPGIADYHIAGQPNCDQHNHIVARYLESTTDLDAVILVEHYAADPTRLDELISVSKALKARANPPRVVIVGPTPRFSDKRDLPTYLARGGSPFVRYTDLPAQIIRAKAEPGAEVLLPEEIFCKDSLCNLLPGGKPLLFDGHHPSLSAAKQTATALAVCLKNGKCN